MMSETPRMSGEAFALERLRQNPDLDFEALRIAGEEAGITLLPIQFGRARRQLGLTGAATLQAAAAPPKASDEQAEAGIAEAGITEAGIAEAANETAPEAAVQPVPGPGLSRPSTPAFEFLVEELRAQPTISYGELKNRADAKGLKIAPIMYGRAKALLGLVPVRPRGQGKNRKKATVTGLPPAEAASREQFAQQIDSVQNVDDLVAIVKQLDGERRRLRAALQTIASQIDEALS